MVDGARIEVEEGRVWDLVRGLEFLLYLVVK